MQWCRFLSVLCVMCMINNTALAASATTPINKTAPAPLPITKAPHSNQHDMWHLIATNFSLSHYTNMPAVQKQIQWFVANPKYFEKIAAKGQPSMYYIYQEVKKRGLPGELVLLPMIESAYDPFAYSWVGAAGLWQMMPATGASFGLKEDWWYDGRKDIIASTSAALDYLTYLETFFNGNWPQAIAAYNSGEGTVQNAIDRNARRGLATSFWSLRLPLETESYVPRLLALAAIVSNPAKYGVTLPPLQAGPYFESVSLQKQIDLAQAAKMAGIPLSLLYQLNPGFNRWATDPKGPYRLLLPLSAVQRFKIVYEQQFGPQTVKGGAPKSAATTNAVLLNKTQSDLLINNAAQKAVKLNAEPTATKTTTSTPHNTGNTTVFSTTNSVTNVAPKSQNSKTKDEHAATAVPAAKSSTATTTSTTATTHPTTSTPATPTTATSASAATLTANPSTTTTSNTPATSTTATSTSATTNTPNPSTTTNTASTTPTSTTEPKKVTPTTLTYTVKKGDTLWKVAQKYHVTIDKLRAWNNLSKRAKLQTGQKLIIHLPDTAA